MLHISNIGNVIQSNPELNLNYLNSTNEPLHTRVPLPNSFIRLPLDRKFPGFIWNIYTHTPFLRVISGNLHPQYRFQINKIIPSSKLILPRNRDEILMMDEEMNFVLDKVEGDSAECQSFAKLICNWGGRKIYFTNRFRLVNLKVEKILYAKAVSYQSTF